jgi:twinkle protein
MNMIVKPSTLDLRSYLTAEKPDIGAAGPVEFRDRLVDLFYGEGKDLGPRMPWIKTHPLIGFAPKEVTMWAGINGHGKSQITGQIALDMAYNGAKVAIGSFEMAPERTLYRMVRQSAREASPSVRYIDAFLAWFQGQMWLLNKKGKVDLNYVQAAIRFCVKEYGITQFFIDNLAKCVRGADDWSSQKEFVDEMTNVAYDTGCHVHIIHHIRKGESEHEVPNKFDIKGAGDIVDLIDNAIIVWRNKKKEYGMANPHADEKQRKSLIAQPDCKLVVVKQRNGSSWEGEINLWYHSHSMSYSEDSIGIPKRYDIAKDIALI